MPGSFAPRTFDDHHAAAIACSVRHAWVVDDLPTTRQWLRQALTQAFGDLRIDEAATLAEARTLLGSSAPQLALIDLGLPDGRGTQLIRELRSAAPGTLIVVPSIFDDDRPLFEALCAGADGYVLKDHSLPKLAQALRALADGQPPLSPSLARLLLRLDAEQTLRLDTETRTLLRYRSRGATPAEAATSAGLEAGTASAALRTLYARLPSLAASGG